MDRFGSEISEMSLAVRAKGARVRLEMGRYLLAEDYVRAMRLRQTLITSVDRALEDCDALVLPTQPVPAPPLGAATVAINGVAEPIRAAMLRQTQLFNITGHPAVALPAPQAADSLPRSVQIVGRHHATTRLLSIARTVEQCLADRGR